MTLPTLDAFGGPSSDRERLARHDARVRLFSCEHGTRLECGDGWYCFDCGSGCGIPGLTS